jgi:glutamine amidotransferase
MITIIDYGVGNLGSIRNMLKRLGTPSVISSDRDIIANADKLILPGVGSFDFGMNKLNDLGIVDILNKRVLEDKIPILGICLGVQLMTKSSREGVLPGLGWFDAETVSFDFSEQEKNLIIPHMGWNKANPVKESKLLKDLEENTKYYFVHSYHLNPKNSEDTLLRTTYGYGFASALERDNIVGVQFHPEKSHKYGMKLLKNYALYY